MKNEAVNTTLRQFVQKHLTPTQDERSTISQIYAAVCSVLGRDKCYQIGSYPRYTAIRPPHDLDVLYSAGDWTNAEPDARPVISELKARLENELVAPPDVTFIVRVQSHSVSIAFMRGGKEEFAVDVVPAWSSGSKNEFRDDIYYVPEILLKGHARRMKEYKRLAEFGGHVGYIRTDPKGYISVAKAINDLNPDFRKSVKLPKKWKCLAKDENSEIKLKSFHIEQIITSYFRENPMWDITAAVTRFFEELPHWISHAQIPDRADASRKIDAYVDDLSAVQKAAILDARDDFLERLRLFNGEQDAEILFIPQRRAAAARVTTAITSSAPAIITERRTVTPRAPFGEC